MCLYKKLIENPKYKANQKNGGVVPPVFDERVLVVPVGCGKCIECMKQKANTWKIRMMEDIKVNTNGKFVTMTFSNEWYKKLYEETEGYGYQRDNEIATLGVRRFLERWRKEYKKSVRHWMITEIGGNGTQNIHIHGIIWTDNKEGIERHWKYGHVFIGSYVDGSTVSYIVKYMSKMDEKHKHYTPKMMTSAGIGKNYITGVSNKGRNKFRYEETKEDYIMPNGMKSSLPIYYRNKIYSDDEREALWLNRMDRQEMYVMGVKISLEDGGRELAGALEYARQTNKQLGYGGETRNIEIKEYENKMRTINQKKRIGEWEKKNKNKKKKEDITLFEDVLEDTKEQQWKEHKKRERKAYEEKPPAATAVVAVLGLGGSASPSGEAGKMMINSKLRKTSEDEMTFEEFEKDFEKRMAKIVRNKG